METIFTESFENELIKKLSDTFQMKKADFYKKGTFVVSHNKLLNSNRINIYHFYQRAVMLIDPNHYKYMKQVVIQNFRNRIMTTQDLLHFWGDQLTILQENESFTYLEPTAFTPFELQNDVTIRKVEQSDHNVYKELQNACYETEWEDAYVSIDHDDNLGIFQNDNLIGMASMINWDDIVFDIGIIIHPEQRKQNFGKMLMSQLANPCDNQDRILQFRFQESDEASQKLVVSIGFKEFMKKISCSLILNK